MEALIRISSALLIFLMACAASAQASIITNTFRGTVVGAYVVDNEEYILVPDPYDGLRLFGGGPILNMPFTLTVQLDTSKAVVYPGDELRHASISGRRSSEPRCTVDRNDPSCTLTNPFDITLNIHGWQRKLNGTSFLMIYEAETIHWSLAATDCDVAGDRCFRIWVPLELKKPARIDFFTEFSKSYPKLIRHDFILDAEDYAGFQRWYEFNIESVNVHTPEPNGLAVLGALALLGFAVRKKRIV